METYILNLNTNITLENSNAEYINPCCEKCDVLLNLIKTEIENHYKVEFEIDQEDWGWYLIFNKNKLIYNLHLSFNNDVTESNEFLFYCFVNKLEKKFIFNRKIEVIDESQTFTEKIKTIFSKLGTIQINK